MPISANEHRQIVKAIASGDPAAAGKAMFDHVIESKERTIKNSLRQLAATAVPLGLVTAALDVNQVPRFHAQAVLQACAPRCQVLMHLANGSHGAMLSPLPPLGPGSLGAQLLGDPPGFDRQATLPRLHRCLSSSSPTT